MRLTALQVTDFKGLHEVTIEPDDHGLIVIGGQNGAGKSSVLDSLTYAFAGRRALGAAGKEPVRRGADAAEVRVELDGGELVIRRRTTAAGTERLEVTQGDGFRVHSPQTMLTELIGARFLDPLDFLSAKPAEQREKLLRCLGIGDDLDRLDEERESAYDLRRLVGRHLKAAKAQLDGCADPGPEPPPGPGPVDVSALRAELDAARSAEAERSRAEEQVQWRRGQVRSASHAVEEAKQRLAAAEHVLKEQYAGLSDASTLLAAVVVPDTWAVELAIGEADATNLGHNAAVEARRRWSEASAVRGRYADAVEAFAADHAKYAATVTACDDAKTAAVAAAPLPVPGIGIEDGGVTMDGLPLGQVASSRQWLVSLAIAAALNPTLQAIWCQGGERLDAAGMDAVEAFALEHDMVIAIERVGTADDGAIIIEDGRRVR